MAKVFAKLEFRHLELHLGHFLDGGLATGRAREILDEVGLTISITDGGWCDFANGTTARVEEQIALTRALGVGRLRLFFSPYGFDEM